MLNGGDLISITCTDIGVSKTPQRQETQQRKIILLEKCTEVIPLWVTTHGLSLQSQPITILLWFPQRPAGGALLNTSHSPPGSLWETAGERAWIRESLTDGLRGGLCTAGALVLWQTSLKLVITRLAHYASIYSCFFTSIRSSALW